MRILCGVEGRRALHSHSQRARRSPARRSAQRDRQGLAWLAAGLFLTAVASALPAGAQQPEMLPGILVQGATLESPPKKPRPPKPAAGASQGTAAANQPAAGAAATGGEGGATDESGVPAEQVGTALTVVTGEQLRAQQIRHAGEALRSLPGVSVNQTGTSAGFTQVRIRGAEANHTLVLIDGIEANASTNGEFDFSDLLSEDIDRIEVLRGPQSALYGSNAVGGVINIVTRSGKGPLRLTARAEGGAFGTRDAAVRASGGTDRAWGAVTAQYRQDEGFNIAPKGPLGEEDGSRLTSLSAKAGVMLADNLRLNLNVRNVEKRGDRDDQTGLQSRDGFIIASDSFSRFSSSVLLAGADLQWDTLGGDLTHVFKATGNRTLRDDVQIADFGFGFGPPSPFSNTSEAYKLAYQATYRFETPLLLAARHSLTGQIEREKESFESVLGSAVTASRAQTGVAAEWRGDFLDRVFLSASVRRDDNDTVQDFTTWRTGISVPIRELGLRPHASIGTAVKLPTLFEQFGQTAQFVANPNLKPEESFGWDAGVEATFAGGRAVVDVTYFSADLKNKIRTEFVSMADPGRIIDCNPGDFFCSYPINLDGTSTREGVEVSGRFQVLPALTLGLAYTYVDAVDRDGQQEIRRPPHSGRADVTYRFDAGRGVLNLAAIYNGDMKDTVFGAPFFFPVRNITLDEYWLVRASAAYQLEPGVEIYGRIENLLDSKYEEVFGFASAGFGAYAGLRLTWDAGLPGSGAMK
jgi:vitamin B12 transporter